MEPSALTDLARLALPVVAGLAGRLGRRFTHEDFARFSGNLIEYSTALSRSTIPVQQRQRLEEDTRTILDHVEKACAASHYQKTGSYPVLSAIAKEQDSWRQIFRFPKLGTKQWHSIQKNLEEYILKTPDFAHLIELLEKCPLLNDHRSADLTPEVDLEETETSCSTQANGDLYEILNMQLNCCSCEPAIHPTRLRLDPRDEAKGSAEAHFEVHFSINSQERRARWQKAKIVASRGQQVNFETTMEQPPALFPRDGPVAIDNGLLCRVLRTSRDPLLPLEMDFPHLRLLRSGGPPVEETGLGDPISLSCLLDGKTPKKEQCILAYTLAKSMWQFYESKWTGVPWTPENLHLLNDGYDGTADSRGSSGLYLAMNFSNPDTDTRIPEFYDADHTMHKYPKLLTLGLLLIEIARGQPLEELQNLGINTTNQRFTLASKYFNRDVFSNEEIYPKYQKAVKMCLAFDLFGEADFDLTVRGSKRALKHRRDILYEKVVAPLKEVLVGTGWWPDVHKIRRVPIIAHERAVEHWAITPATPYPKITPKLDSFPNSKPKWTSDYWIIKMCAMSAPICNGKPVRIAVIDTGCNLGAPIFDTRGQEARVKKHWKDFAGQSSVPEDEDGHGTCIVSLLLRIAPKAEIYVARIAKKLEDLQSSSRSVANAIEQAAAHEVDIVSLSFGFPNQDCTIRNAIDEAHRNSDHSITFLAAAANDGSNTTERFPAFMESVISIRGTNSTGAFVSDYDPNPHPFKRGRPVYGTLGQNIFCGWPEEPEGLQSFLMSGCSIATPIAAAIAALIIGYVHSSGLFNENHRRKIRSRRAIEQVFHSISVEKGNNRFYLAPWDLLNSEGEIRVSTIQHAIDGLPD